MRIVLCILILFSLSYIYGQVNNMEDYQVASFNGVTRFSFTFTRRPITNVRKVANSLRFDIEIPQCSLGNLPERFTTNDMFASELQITSSGRDLIVTITTTRAFDEIRQSAVTGQRYILHLDVFRTLSPQNIEDIVSMLDYYHFVGNTSARNDLMRTAQSMYPNNADLTRRSRGTYNQPTIHSPRPSRTQPTQTAQNPRTTQTTPATPQRTTQQSNTTAQPAQTIQDTPPPPPPPTIRQEATTSTPVLPQRSEPRNVNPENVSMILITRHDRFPARIPQTKPVFAQPAAIPQQPVEPVSSHSVNDTDNNVVNVESAVQEEPSVTPSITPDPAPLQQQPLDQVRQDIASEQHIVYRAVTDTTGLSESEKLILSYYRIASSDSILVAFLVGASANIVGDNQNAILYLSQVPDTDVNYENALALLFDSYTAMGDVANANFYASLISAANADSTDINFINTQISLWMVGIAVGITLILGFTIAAITFGLKKSKQKNITELDYSTHVTNIKRAYDKKKKSKPSQSVDEIENTDTLSEHYDDPPIITEELTNEESAELKAEENPLNNVPEEDLGDMQDNEYRKNLILKLHKDGWNLEEIAKELQISQREIDFIIRVNG